MNKIIMTDGQNTKGVSLLNSNDPTVWNYFSNMPKSDQTILYSRVAAAFRAYNLLAETVSSVPFSLVDMKSKKEYDASVTWENKVGYLPNPQELFRLNVLSYIDTNTFYNLRTTDALGYKVKGLYHAVPTTFKPIISPITGKLIEIERNTGTEIEHYKPDDKRLIRAWRLDQNTEVLPSPHTIGLAIMNAAGVLYYTDLWIKHYYQRGGIKPTLIAMKGLLDTETKDDKENKWSDWLRGLGQYTWKIARIFNAEQMDIKTFGDGVADLKDNNVYRQSLENIAIGIGMPLSLLLSNSANMATATIEERQFYKTTVTPICRWMAYEYNTQAFHADGLHGNFNTSTVDSQQEEDAVNADTAKKVLELLQQCPTYELFVSISGSYLQLTDDILLAAEKYYKDKQANAAIVAAQTQPKETEETIEAEAEDVPKELPEPAKWIPSLDQLRELQRWQELAFRKLKRAEPLPTDWRNDTLPDAIYDDITLALLEATDEPGIKAAFEWDAPVSEQKADPAILQLAAAMNRYADVLNMTKQIPAST